MPYYDPNTGKNGSAAILAAQLVNYVGAGTVEFLLASSGEFFFGDEYSNSG